MRACRSLLSHKRRPARAQKSPGPAPLRVSDNVLAHERVRFGRFSHEVYLNGGQLWKLPTLTEQKNGKRAGTLFAGIARMDNGKIFKKVANHAGKLPCSPFYKMLS